MEHSKEPLTMPDSSRIGSQVECLQAHVVGDNIHARWSFSIDLPTHQMALQHISTRSPPGALRCWTTFFPRIHDEYE